MNCSAIAFDNKAELNSSNVIFININIDFLYIVIYYSNLNSLYDNILFYIVIV